MDARIWLMAAFYAFMAISIATAFAWGDRTERQVAQLLLGLFVLQQLLRLVSAPTLDWIDMRSLVTDVAAFAGFVWIGARSPRYWPLIAAALQLLAVAAHIARASGLPVDPMVYAYMKSAPTFFVLVALLLGTLFYQRRRRRTLCARYSPSSKPKEPLQR